MVVVNGRESRDGHDSPVQPHTGRPLNAAHDDARNTIAAEIADFPILPEYSQHDSDTVIQGGNIGGFRFVRSLHSLHSIWAEQLIGSTHNDDRKRVSKTFGRSNSYHLQLHFRNCIFETASLKLQYFYYYHLFSRKWSSIIRWIGFIEILPSFGSTTIVPPKYVLDHLDTNDLLVVEESVM